MTPRRQLLALPAALAATPALAHHGWGGFDRDQARDISAPVLRSTYANPHGMIVLAEGGRELSFELAPVGRMQARGLAAADIAPGQRVRLLGYRNVQNATLYRAEWIEVAGRRVELR